MRQCNKLLFLAVFGALVLPLMFLGTGWAQTYPDGSKPNAAGLWDITDYGRCVSGVDNAGNLYVDTAHTLSRPDCIDHVLGHDNTVPQPPGGTDYNTSAKCTATSGRSNNDNVSHYWVTGTCIDPATGLGINLDGLDRTATAPRASATPR